MDGDENSEERRKQKYERDHEQVSLKQAIDRYNQVQIDKKEIRRWKKRIIEVGKDTPVYGEAYEPARLVLTDIV